MKLNAGERYILTGTEMFARILSGEAEVYAVSREDTSFRQMYLITLGVGDTAYPAGDELGFTDILIYALTDIQVDIKPFKSQDISAHISEMRRWFNSLVQIKWLALLANRGDDVLGTWQDGAAFSKSFATLDDLLEDFWENQNILTTLIGVQFLADDKRLTNQTIARLKSKYELLDAVVGSLLGEETHFGVSLLADEKNKRLEEISFITQTVAHRLSMNTENMTLAAELTQNMDETAILKRLIQKGNMQMRKILLEEGWHRKDSGVIIAQLENSSPTNREWAALIPDTARSYRVITVSEPKGITLTDEILQNISPEAYQCYAGFPTRSLKLIDLMKFMFGQCWKADYATILAVSFIAGLIPLVTPIITETIFQDIIPIYDRQGLATVTQVAMVTGFTMAALSIVRSIAVLRITAHIDMAAEAALWGRLLSLPTKFFRQFTAGELASRMGGLGAAKSVVSGEFATSVFSFIFSFWSLFLMCWYSLKLTAVAIVLWLVYCGVTAVIYRRVLGFQRKLIAASNESAGVIKQIFTGLAKFRVRGAEEQAFYLWSKVFGEQWKWNLKLRWQSNYNGIIASIQPFILTMCLYYIAVYGMDGGAAEAAKGQTTKETGIGYAQFLAFQAAFTGFNATLSGFIPLVGQFFSIQPHLENLRPIMNEMPESIGDKQDAGRLSGVVEARHLSFAYPLSHGKDDGIMGTEVLKDVSFRIKAGENVAIVGKSGCGKSTLVRLLLGFETPKSGNIYFDGHDLSDLNLPSVRSQMGVVLQNGQLMSGDIFTNIVGTSNLTMEDAWAAAEAAGIAEDIRLMPMGMQTVISEDSSNISGGQRQRLLIARALAGKPAIVIFDEATSALDNRTQAIVTRSLNALNATRIVVAHRLSTIRKCDRILMIDGGKIAESGTFDELVEKGGIFAELVKRQMV